MNAASTRRPLKPQRHAHLDGKNVEVRTFLTDVENGASKCEALLSYLHKSMARDLHDSFPQEFQAVLMHLHVALEAKSCAEAKHHVEQAIASAQTGLDCVRALVKELRAGPPRVETVTPQVHKVSEVVAQAARGALATHAVDFRLINDSADIAVRSGAVLDIAMIVREAIHNALKHAAPSRIICHLETRGTLCSIVVQDNGNGFDKTDHDHGFGLLGMQERAIAIGAVLSISSSRFRGCAVALELPPGILVRVPNRRNTPDSEHEVPSKQPPLEDHRVNQESYTWCEDDKTRRLDKSFHQLDRTDYAFS